MKIRTSIAAFGLALYLLGQPAMAGPLEDGEAAFERGEFAIALQVLKPLAEQGDGSAQHILGLMYQLGFGVPQDPVESAKWNLKAAEQGNGIAQSDMGWIYYRGLGVSRNIVLAYMWLYLSVAHGEDQNVDSIADVAKEMTPEQIAEAQRIAREWLAAHPVRNYNETLNQTLQRGAERGDATSQYVLGFRYRQGSGVPQSDTEAVKWWRKAADQADADAAYEMGSACEEGRGVPQDYVQALMWYNLAILNRLPWNNKRPNEVVEQRDNVAAKMTPEQIAEAQRLAREWTAAHPKN